MGQGNGSRRLKSQDMMPEPVRRTQLLGDEEWTAEIGSSRDGHADGCRRMPWDAFVDAVLRRGVALFLEQADWTVDPSAVVTGAEVAARMSPAPLQGRIAPGVVGGYHQAVEEGRKLLAAHQHECPVLARLVDSLGLCTDELDVFVFLVGLDLEVGRQRMLAYAQDDQAATNATLGALRQLFPPPHGGAMTLRPDGRLCRAALVAVGNEPTWARRRVSLPDAVVWSLLGEERAAGSGLPLGAHIRPGTASPGGRAPLLVLAGGDRESRLRRCQEILDGQALVVSPDGCDVAGCTSLVRSATLGGSAVALEADGGLAADTRRMIEVADHLNWAVLSASDLPLEQLPEVGWREETLARAPVPAEEVAGALGDPDYVTGGLDREQLRLATLARDGRGQTASDAVRRLASSQADSVVRIRSRRTWDDLVLPAEEREQLEALVARRRHHQLVFRNWGFDAGMPTGLVCLFSGPSGTGKTLAAEVVAGALGIDLFKIDLSGVLSKYIGETERHLEEIFRFAEGVDVVLLLDEADALLGTRTDIGDAHDRYANVQVSYLLQRLERYEGTVILATNLPKNIDSAVLRRIQVDVRFRMPEEPQRLAIWERSFPAHCPTRDLDLALLAKTLEVSGAVIHNAALAAAFSAAATAAPVTMALVVDALRAELRKLGRFVEDDERFGVLLEKAREG